MTQTIQTHIGPITSGGMILREFLSWYFLCRPIAIIGSYGRSALAYARFFSILFLLRTLLSPWKGIVDEAPSGKGFSLEDAVSRFFLNLTTRFIGAAIRLAAIVAGIIVQVLLLAVFTAYLCVWILFPILVIAAFLPL